MRKKKSTKTGKARGGGASGATTEAGLAPTTEVKMYQRAVGSRWIISAKQKAEAVRVLQRLARQKRDVRAAARAVQVLASLEAQNQADEHKAHHYERLDEGKATERVAMEPVILREAIEPPKER